MRFSRKLAFGLGALAALVLMALLVLPLLYRDRIAARLKRQLDGSVNARLAWDGVGLSALRDFPNVTLSLDRFSVVGVKPFEGDTLATVHQARLTLDVGSVIRYLMRGDRIVIRQIALNRPAVQLHVLADGRANWDIARQREGADADTARAVGVTLRDLRISGGSITINDRQSHLVASIHGLEESLKGDFARDRFVLATRTRADSVSLRFAGVPYLSRVGLELNADVDADLRAHTFAFRNNSLRLNKLVLAFGGTIARRKPDVALDLTFSAPSTAFADILSLVPAIYARDFAQLRTSGSMSMSGRVNGSYGPHAFPALALRAKVENGAFKYPALPLAARDIFMDLAVDNPGGHVDSTVVDLKRLHASIGGRALDARLVMRTPVSDPDVDLRATGALNLADVGRTVKLEGVSELAGTIAADVAMHARVSDVDAGRYDRVSASGTMNVGRLALRSATIPHPIAVDTAALRFTPRTAALTSFSARIGSSDVRATGSLDNVLGFALHDQDLRGRAAVASTRFNLDEWRSREKTTEAILVPPRIDFTLQASANHVTYGALTMANVRGDLRVKDQRVTLHELRMETLRGTVVANGGYETTVAARPTFDVDLRLATVDIPAAFAALTTVRRLAPIAQWAQGAVSGTVGLKGPLGHDMTPVFTALTGKGALETERLVVQGAPALEKVAGALKLVQLRNPSLGAVRASYDVADGRVHVTPFVVRANGIDVTVSGSHGIDQSLDYDLALAQPPVGVHLTGSITNPTVKMSVDKAIASARNALQQEVATRTNAAKQKADSAVEDARRRARAESDRIVADAERRADSVRAGARRLAAATRREGAARVDSLLARATNPAARMAAKMATDRLRQETDQQADRIVREADARADSLVAQAKRRATAPE